MSNRLQHTGWIDRERPKKLFATIPVENQLKAALANATTPKSKAAIQRAMDTLNVKPEGEVDTTIPEPKPPAPGLRTGAAPVRPEETEGEVPPNPGQLLPVGVEFVDKETFDEAQGFLCVLCETEIKKKSGIGRHIQAQAHMDALEVIGGAAATG